MLLPESEVCKPSDTAAKPTDETAFSVSVSVNEASQAKPPDSKPDAAADSTVNTVACIAPADASAAARLSVTDPAVANETKVESAAETASPTLRLKTDPVAEDSVADTASTSAALNVTVQEKASPAVTDSVIEAVDDEVAETASPADTASACDEGKSAAAFEDSETVLLSVRDPTADNAPACASVADAGSEIDAA